MMTFAQIVVCSRKLSRACSSVWRTQLRWTKGLFGIVLEMRLTTSGLSRPFDLPPLDTPPRPSRRQRLLRAQPDPPDGLFSPLSLPPTQISSQSPPRIRPLMPVRGFSSSSSSPTLS